MPLRTTIQQLASSFAASVLEAIRTTSLEELMAEARSGRVRAGAKVDGARAPRSSGRLPRRSQADIARTVSDIAALLKKHKNGLRAEQIRAELGLEAKEMPRPLSEGLKTKAFKKKGHKRATTYFAL